MAEALNAREVRDDARTARLRQAEALLAGLPPRLAAFAERWRPCVEQWGRTRGEAAFAAFANDLKAAAEGGG